MDLKEKEGKKYPVEIRKMIYTTNAIEGLHKQTRKVTKTKGSLTSQSDREVRV